MYTVDERSLLRNVRGEYREFEVLLRKRNKDINFGLKIKRFRTF